MSSVELQIGYNIITFYWVPSNNLYIIIKVIIIIGKTKIHTELVRISKRLIIYVPQKLYESDNVRHVDRFLRKKLIKNVQVYKYSSIEISKWYRTNYDSLKR